MQQMVARMKASDIAPPPLLAMYCTVKTTPAAGAMWAIDWKGWLARPRAPAASLGCSNGCAIAIARLLSLLPPGRARRGPRRMRLSMGRLATPRCHLLREDSGPRPPRQSGGDPTPGPDS